MAEEIKTIEEKSNFLKHDTVTDLTTITALEGNTGDGTPKRVPTSLIATEAEVSELSEKVGDLETDLSSHTTNTDNPHGVTISQLVSGMSIVDNMLCMEV